MSEGFDEQFDMVKFEKTDKEFTFSNGETIRYIPARCRRILKGVIGSNLFIFRHVILYAWFLTLQR